MQGHTMYINCRRQGFVLTEDEAQEYCDTWAKTFPEMSEYFAVKSDGESSSSYTGLYDDDEEDEDEAVYDDSEDNGKSTIKRTYKNSNILGMVRVKATRNAALNFPFQSLAAVISKRALWLTYLDSLKYGYMLTNFIHDEIIVECREEIANEVAERVKKCMLQAAKEIIPEMLMKAEPAIMRRWSKDAEPAFDENGKLIPFEDAIKMVS